MQSTVEEYRLGVAFRMGVPTPRAPRIGEVTGDPVEAGSQVITTFYTVTFVNKYGEEGDLSVPSSFVEYQLGQTIEVTNLGDVLANSSILSDYDSVVAYRLYRFEDEGNRFVTEQTIDTNTYENLTTDTLGESFLTTDFVPPPEDMRGLHLMANGIALGFVGRTVYVSETQPDKRMATQLPGAL